MKVKLSPAQKRIAAWAIAPMYDYAGVEGEFSEDEIPRIVGDSLVLDHCSADAVDDFLYRVGVQFLDMVCAELPPGYQNTVRAAEQLVSKIKKEINDDQDKAHNGMSGQENPENPGA